MLKKKDNIAILLAARSGSKRLQNKHFLKLKKDLTVIDLCIQRLKKSRQVKKIFLCTTKKKTITNLFMFIKNHDIGIYRGSVNNVSKRLIDCAKENSIKIIVRITADCPLIDPILIDKCIKYHYLKKSDYTSNVIELSYPDGLDVEVLNLKALIKSQKLSNTKYNNEHVTSFIRRSKKFKKYNIKCSVNYSNRRWTLDFMKDFLFLKKF